MAEVMEAAVEEQAAVDEAGAERRATPLLLATDACCAAGHDTALVERGGAIPALVCVTCTALWGRLEERRSWQANWPDCFAKAHPEGLTDLGITAQALADDE